ncbi:MAG: hypothetical protein NTW21_07155 [Verrucomicrobia bacterium]|nr:hypothetical protein [Verrucomicrobiota bacterium]
MKTVIFPLLALCCSAATLGTYDLGKLSCSEFWQVRYGVTHELTFPTAEARTILERLAVDTEIRVAHQAFEVYSRMFVDVDKGIASKAFDRGDLNILGSDGPEGMFKTTRYWLADLKRKPDDGGRTWDDESGARAVRVLGLLGDASVLPELAGLPGSRKPGFLTELAAAYRRLGSDEPYLAAVGQVLALPVKDNLPHQTIAIGYLLQTHPARAKQAWERIHGELAGSPDLQPAWVYGHYLQQEFLAGGTLTAPDIEKLGRSEVWQVRYCVNNMYPTRPREKKATMERLSVDTNARVAQQAFVLYSRTIVDIDKDIVRKALDRGDWDPPEYAGVDPKMFRTSKYWLDELGRREDAAAKAGAIAMLGLLGDANVLTAVTALPPSSNPFYLAEVALAYRRLGSNPQYLATLEQILALPVKDNLYYQTIAIDYLLQTHPDRARQAWETINLEIAKVPDLQANWVYGHVLQREQLP